ncbi:phage major capsid protein [Methylobacterium sp.]|uniref:phage major capsid protein n=1 Tax=Methylobacterium sp. TaxID=409 RepID=UPI0025E9D3E7|nr:phage major capsid protein [Methylobacterium sp.]MBY0256130.1 phage major capsid protein [Methylobacterium sp.]
MKIHELREQKANRVAEMRGLVDKAETEKRDLTDGERGRFDALKGEVSGLEVRIGQRETLENLERHAEATPVGGTGGVEALEARYSIGKAIDEFSRTGRLTGAEGEFAAERRSGRKDSFSAPVSLFLGGERRYVGTQQPAAGPGGALVATNLGPLIDRPRPNLAVAKLGATTLTGLTGNLDLPRQKSSGTAKWVPEHGPATGSDPQFEKVSMGPKTVTGKYEVTRRMMIQAPQIEQVLRYDLGFILAQALDLAAVMGTGANDAPRGIKGTPGVHRVPGAFADPQKPTIAELDDLVATMTSLVEDADIGGSTGFLAHPAVKSTLNRYRGADGALIGVAGIFKGEPTAWSTQVPANGGTSTNLAQIFYGNWPDLLVGYWSSVDIMLNPYAAEMADRGGAYLHAFLDADVAVRHPESFVFTDDFPTKALASSVIQ